MTYQSRHLRIPVAALLAVGGTLVCCTLTGCTTTTSGNTAFSSMQAAVTQAADPIKSSVVLVKMTGMKGGGDARLVMSGGRLRRQSSSQKTTIGVLVTTNGFVVVQDAIKPGDVERIAAWVGDTEYRAKLVKADDELKMAILKLDTEDVLTPLPMDNPTDLATGQWCVTVKPSDESQEYAAFTSLAMCRGQVPGRYRQFMLDSLGGMSQGGPVVSLDGKVAGLLSANNTVLSMTDLRSDLAVLIDEAAGVTAPDEEARKKGWFGASLLPINKEHARKHGLPKSALWVVNTIEGGPAHSAGVRAGDLVIGVNGQPMQLSGSRAHDFFLKVLRPRVDQPFAVTVLRDGTELELAGTVAKRPEPETVRADDIGVTVQLITDKEYSEKNLFTREGVLVTDVKRGSPAAISGSMGRSLINKQDVITSIGGVPITNLDSFSTALERVRRDRPGVLLVTYERGRAAGHAALNLKIGENGEGISQ